MKQYKYTVKGTLSGSRCYEDYTERMSPEELADYMEEISALFSRDPEDELAQYIHKSGYRDAMLYGSKKKYHELSSSGKKGDKTMKDTLKAALEYAMALDEGAPRIKKRMEDFLASTGYDRRRKIKWGTDNCNKHYFSGIFWYAGEKYYFTCRMGRVEELTKI